MKRLPYISAKFAVWAAAFALTGCATSSLSEVPVGTYFNDVTKEFGNPQVSCPQPDGSTRMIWTEEPAGEQVWVTTVGSDQRISPFEQVMQPNMFDVLNTGEWNAATVRCQFGPPARTQVFPDHPQRIVWEYRFVGGVDQNFMMLYISFDRMTNQMINYSTGPDPQLNLLMNGR